MLYQSHLKNKFRRGRKNKRETKMKIKEKAGQRDIKTSHRKKIRHLETTHRGKRQKSTHIQKNTMDNLEIYKATVGKPIKKFYVLAPGDTTLSSFHLLCRSCSVSLLAAVLCDHQISGVPKDGPTSSPLFQVTLFLQVTLYKPMGHGFKY